MINGAERLLVDNVRLQGDSVYINMPFFDSRFAARIEDSMHLTGNYIKNYGDHLVEVPFKAIYHNTDPAGFVKDRNNLRGIISPEDGPCFLKVPKTQPCLSVNSNKRKTR